MEGRRSAGWGVVKEARRVEEKENKREKKERSLDPDTVLWESRPYPNIVESTVFMSHIHRPSRKFEPPEDWRSSPASYKACKELATAVTLLRLLGISGVTWDFDRVADRPHTPKENLAWLSLREDKDAWAFQGFSSRAGSGSLGGYSLESAG